MKIETTTFKKVYTTDQKELLPGSETIFVLDGKCYCGIFTGITKYSTLGFDGVLSDVPVHWNVKPESIEALYLIEHKFV